MKTVENSGDWNCAYHNYRDGQSVIDTRLNDDPADNQEGNHNPPDQGL